MKISHSIFLSFVFILLLFSITTFINSRLSQTITENEDYFSRSTDIIRNSGRFQRNILTMVNGLRGYLLTGEKSFVESYDAANNENDSILHVLSSLLIGSSQTHLLAEIKSLNDKWTDEFTEPLKQVKMVNNTNKLEQYNKAYKERYATGSENDLLRLLQQKFREFSSSEYQIRDARKAALADSVRRTKNLSLALTIVSVITGLIVVILLVRKISRRINQMTGMANAISEGNFDVIVTSISKDELSSLGNSLNHMAEMLSKNISLLKRSNQELDQYAHIVSHDLKGPLRGISNVISWIEEDHKSELSAKMAEYLELIKGRVIRAENLIQGLLAYARINKDAMNIETVDVNVLVHELIENLPDKTNIQYQVSPLPVLQTEKLLLYQVFYNLLTNAVKYNNKKAKQVKIYYKDSGPIYHFFVQDNGVGIEEQYFNRIFVIFQTLNDRDSFESTGVGLAIVKKILDGKKQNITVISEPGKGSTFSFTWPKNLEDETSKYIVG
jgi:signal transduction histidine kinase